ncbi:LysE family translocator [Erwinia sorbitola]|uniref:LysE family translocator n=1 Tax=Erwinia sorbitola TaxID=2681984 RepID=A0A6I6EVE8_9GAMM|nr:LysE family translocator [Erwinia sorbitola]MTD27552.1 LysE family translocator [Erwinia sorbitola]QGU89089.1 LysE family translocator [Erwinia sorbitola]
MALHLFVSFWAVSILFVITPGVDWAYAMSAGMWKRAVTPAVAGLLLGHLIATLAVAAGVGALVTETPAALTLLTVAGALYLLWLGINMVIHPSVPAAGNVHSTGSWFTWLAKGVCVSGMNPKVFLLFLALLPQFTDPASAWPVPLQILALGGLHIVSCGLVYLLVGFGSGKVLQTRPRAAQRVSQISGIVMCLIALLLLAESLF